MRDMNVIRARAAPPSYDEVSVADGKSPDVKENSQACFFFWPFR
jgi:hypothetical protein